MGLCSGAHTAFHAGLEERLDVAGLVMINPLTYRWQEGMSLEVAQQFKAVQHYRKSARDPERWLKLCAARSRCARVMKARITHAIATLKSNLESLRETFQPSKASQLSRDLRKLFSMRRRVALIISEGDPGAEMLFAGARRAAAQAIQSGAVDLRYIEGADHTFSQLASRRALGEQLRELFSSQYRRAKGYRSARLRASSSARNGAAGESGATSRSSRGPAPGGSSCRRGASRCTRC